VPDPRLDLIVEIVSAETFAFDNASVREIPLAATIVLSIEANVSALVLEAGVVTTWLSAADKLLFAMDSVTESFPANDI
jgi:hypothetical protein